MHWLSVGAAARDACCAARRLSGAKNATSRHCARPARGGSRSCASTPITQQRADAARRGQNMERASSAPRSLSGGARPCSSGRPITSAARSQLRRSATRLPPRAALRPSVLELPRASDYADGADGAPRARASSVLVGATPDLGPLGASQSAGVKPPNLRGAAADVAWPGRCSASGTCVGAGESKGKAEVRHDARAGARARDLRVARPRSTN